MRALKTTRQRVVGPEEEQPQEDFYLERPGHAPVNMTALREAERKFKAKNFTQNLGLVLTPESPRMRLVGRLPDDAASHLRPGAPVYEIDGVPGFKYIPGALTEVQQQYWAQACFTDYMKAPNQNNLDLLYTGLPSTGLYNALEERLTVTRREDGVPLTIDRLELLSRVRWTTLGYQYDWSSKTYRFDEAPVPFPPDLFAWSRHMASALGYSPAFRAEAGIVNYYQMGDTLTSHVDRSEQNMEAPLLSLSLGSACVFLVGGADREAPVTPLVLRSGDVSVLAGASRRFFHGVPRILPGSCPAHLIDLLADARLNINIRQVT